MKSVRISVAMATYNGEKYIEDQINSIIGMLSPKDEIVISDDGSTDLTVDIIKRYASKYDNIHYYQNNLGKGIDNNFSNAIMNCKGKYIFISDQDDIWIQGKIDAVLKAFADSGADLVVHNGCIVDEKLNKISNVPLIKANHFSTNWFVSLVKPRLYGCCMAFKSSITEWIVPLYGGIDKGDYDTFISIVVGLKGKIFMLDECYIMHRIHDSNFTSNRRRCVKIILKERYRLLKAVVSRIIKLVKKGR